MMTSAFRLVGWIVTQYTKFDKKKRTWCNTLLGCTLDFSPDIMLSWFDNDAYDVCYKKLVNVPCQHFIKMCWYGKLHPSNGQNITGLSIL